MRRLFTTLVVAAGTVLVPVCVAQAETVTGYVCSDGMEFTLTLTDSKEAGDLTLKGQGPERVTREAGSSADMYSGETVSFFADQSTVSLAYMKGSEQVGTDCKKK